MGFRVGRSTEGCFDEPPQPHHHKRDHGDPERDDAARFGGQCRQCPGLVSGAAADAEGDPDGDVADDQVHHAAHDEPGAGESFEDKDVEDELRHLISVLRA